MALKHFNPVTPSLRGTVLIDRKELWKGKPVKGLTEGKNKSGGRNNHGRTTSRFIGGGHKQSYRYVDFKRRKFDVVGTVERLEYDPNRTASSPSSSMRMANWPTSSHRSASRQVIRSLLVPGLISSRVTRCPCRRFRWARLSTTSSSRPVVVGRSPVPLVPTHSWSAKMWLCPD